MIEINLPGSKSITNRDLILAAISNGDCLLSGFLESVDTKMMINALKDLGLIIKYTDKGLLVSKEGNGFMVIDKDLYIHQSGTSMRFLTGLALLNKSGSVTVSGDDRLNSRPMNDLILGIKQLGIEISSNDGYPPVTIKGSKVTNNKISMSGKSSSQFFTSLLNVGALFDDGLEISVEGDLVSKPYIDITLNELKKFGVKVINQDYKKFIITKQDMNSPGELIVEGDASALSYIANLSLLLGKDIFIKNLNGSTKQGDYKYLSVLTELFNFSYVSDIQGVLLQGSKGYTVNSDILEVDFESMPDVSMSLMVIAPLLNNGLKITGLQTLNLKECKRVDVMAEGLLSLGVKLDFNNDSITIQNGFGEKIDATIKSYDDHRIAMSFAAIKTYLEIKDINNRIKITEKDCVTKTYPKFWDDLEFILKNK